MPILEKCERVLQQIAGPPGQDPTPGTDPNQHMCQALLDVVSGNIKKPNINHTLNRTFKPVMDKLRPEPCAAPRREKSYAPIPPCPARNPKEIPSILQGEVAALNKKFRAQLNNSYLNASGDIHIIVQINDPALPPVRPLKVTIPVGYPKIPPIIEGENEQMTQFLDSGANIDDSTDFLTTQQLLFEERLDQLGPDLVTLTQVLSAWELSIRQALARLNIIHARQRQSTEVM